jgi:glycosyltransferase involved in cell wall biosynthesis
VLAVSIDIELLCVDDGSRDGSHEILAELQSHHRQLSVFLQPQNMDKGLPCVVVSRKRRETSLSFKTLTWSMTRANIRKCWNR